MFAISWTESAAQRGRILCEEGPFEDFAGDCGDLRNIGRVRGGEAISWSASSPPEGSENAAWLHSSCELDSENPFSHISAGTHASRSDDTAGVCGLEALEP